MCREMLMLQFAVYAHGIFTDKGSITPRTLNEVGIRRPLTDMLSFLL